MSSTFYVEILTPERKFFWGDVESIILRSPTGEFQILKGHQPMVIVVDIGPIKILKDGKWIEAVLGEGYLTVEHEKTVILTDTAEWPDEIDLNRARAAKERAEERLLRQLNKEEYIRSKAAIARAMARLKVNNHNHE